MFLFRATNRAILPVLWRTPRLVRLIAGIKAAAPDRTLQQIAAQLEAMHERTPRGGTRWHPSSVKHLLARAQRLGLAATAKGPAEADF